MRRPSGTVTFLFSDIEGSTRLLHALGAEGYRSSLEEHRRIARDAIAEAGGEEVDTQGDAFFVAFHRVQDAVAAAAAIQRRLAGHAWPQGADLRTWRWRATSSASRRRMPPGRPDHSSRCRPSSMRRAPSPTRSTQ